MGLLTCQPQGEVGWIYVLLPSGGGNEQQEGVIIYEVPAGGWMLCSSPLQSPHTELAGVSYHLL